MLHSTIGILSLCLTNSVLAASASFGLYAYGDNIGGLQMYYADGNAVVSKQAPTSANSSAPVIFTHDKDGLIGNPNSTDSANKPDFSNASLFVPGSSAEDHQVGFTDDPGTNQVTNKFVWYGNFLMVEDDSGEYTSLFTVKKSSSSTNDGEYSLQWNVTDDEEVIAISMRSIAPSNE
ncbi:hypothetical protein P170DRAFT_397042 [Aspergillus steynii IBT 23096]|uniref:Uncharacterized protein n=1 Tax=Aspergillus steynii IBT 23096 TaxID=1392250 RepID=A0A2I2GMC7_9EURO|nr:uncharacterized protein P170DRAFT_397042 [Aspergillus steynii IBT 23096]PLB54038.1 hypothetical protein P170DRAFT_397042 [Aspergillus steynii IBT 23096]